MNNYVVSVFWLLGNYFCALNAVANHCSISMTENIILFINTYGEDTKFNPGWQPFFNNFYPPSPISPVGDTCLFTIFVYIFGKGEEGRGRYSGGLDPPPLCTLHWQTNIPPTIRWLSFDITHSWQLTFPMLMFIPHMWWFPCWWSSLIFVLMMIVIDEVRLRCLHVYFCWLSLLISVCWLSFP